MRRSLLGVVLGTLVSWSSAQIDYDSYDGGEVDFSCSFYESDYAEECQHSKFPNGQSIQDMFGGNRNIQLCCHDNGYLFHDHCESRNFNGKEVCGYPFKDPEYPRFTLLCPSHCAKQDLIRDRYDVFANGTLWDKRKEQGHPVGEYCLGYHCPSESTGWNIKAQVCECLDQERIIAIDRGIGLDHQRCCPTTLQVNFHQSLIHCPRAVTEARMHTEKALTCDFPNTWHRLKFDDVLFANGQASFSLGVGPNESRRVNISSQELNYCVGATQDPMTRELEASMMYCHEPCFGQEPCIPTCDDTANLIRSNVTFNGTFDRFSTPQYRLDLEYLDQLAPIGRLCPHGQDRNNILRPEERCSDEFIIDISNQTHPMLQMIDQGEVKGNFCINFESHMRISVEICRDTRTHETRLSFYPYILITSSVFLLLTFIVYTAYPKLLNYYTKLMKHFVLNMFFSFIILSINQFTLLKDVSLLLCQLSAFVQQYLFLAAFSFMTLMSAEISLQMSGRGTSERRYKKERLIGYLAPLGISALTLLFELTGPSCSPIRPRFGEERCFFSDKASKFTWFYFPIMVMLSINMVMFIRVVLTMIKVNKEKDKLQLNYQKKKRSDKKDRFILYCRLAIGMGLIWFFEILAGMIDSHEASWYFTDILNMSQGIYIFIVFVCKRNVFNVIFSQRRGASGTTGGRMALRNLSKRGQKNSKEEAYPSAGPSKVSEANTKSTTVPTNNTVTGSE